ncbi:hypothetical protein A4E84_17095 [Streptomyces qaidamensis]|uniref:Uncharacterized protein n=1 Tax=Streptomyces qaidamensis TaxID=1783515 RepID=A0A143C1L2_9ACTN|nr:hypothetical protein [Streptomyces qaidamensis]AMW11070.1 hypothetical protein A4E84_17095 [Streptomyces qaidamensis]
MIRITKRCSAAVVLGSAVLATLAWAAPAQAAGQQGTGPAVAAQGEIPVGVVLPHLPGSPDDFTWTPLPLGGDDFTWNPGPLHSGDDFSWHRSPAQGPDDFTWQPGPVGER